KFWEAETLFRLQRFAEARPAYDAVVKKDATGPRAPDALYGLAWSDLELHRPEVAIVEFRELLDRWPDYALVPSAKLHLARTLVEQKRFGDALPLLESFATKYPNHKQLPDAQYLLGLARVKSGDAKAGLADLRAFVAAAPNHELVPAARRLIMETITRQGDRGELEGAYEVLMDQTPATPEALSDAASIAGRLGRFGAAAKTFEAVSGVKNIEVGIRYRALAGLGLAREQLKDLRGALTAYESVVRGSPDATLRDWARDRAQVVKSQLGRTPA